MPTSRSSPASISTIWTTWATAAKKSASRRQGFIEPDAPPFASIPCRLSACLNMPAVPVPTCGAWTGIFPRSARMTTGPIAVAVQAGQSCHCPPWLAPASCVTRPVRWRRWMPYRIVCPWTQRRSAAGWRPRTCRAGSSTSPRRRRSFWTWRTIRKPRGRWRPPCMASRLADAHWPWWACWPTRMRQGYLRHYATKSMHGGRARLLRHVRRMPRRWLPYCAGRWVRHRYTFSRMSPARSRRREARHAKMIEFSSSVRFIPLPPCSTMPPPSSENDLKRLARRRLIGAVALTLLAVIALPLLLEDEPPPTSALSVHMAEAPAPVPEQAAAPVSAAEPASSMPSQPAPPPEPTKPAEPAKPVARPEPKPEAEPAKPEPVKAELAKPQSKPHPVAAPVPQKKPAAASEMFVVQLAALSDGAKARELKARAALAGLPTYTDTVGSLTRVRVV